MVKLEEKEHFEGLCVRLVAEEYDFEMDALLLIGAFLTDRFVVAPMMTVAGRLCLKCSRMEVC